MLFGCVFCCALLAPIVSVSGGRIRHLQNAPSGNEAIWNKDQSFICVQKWEKSSRRFVGKFCLADTESVLKGVTVVKEAQTRGKETPMMRFAEDTSQCQSPSAPHQLQLCFLKGKEDIRLAYSDRVYVPKSCFVQCTGEQNICGVNVLTAAVTGRTCEMMKSLSPHIQKVFARRIASTTTTTTTSTQAPEAPAPIEKPTTTTTTVSREASKVSEEDSLDVIDDLVLADDNFERTPSVFDLDPEHLEHDDAIEEQTEDDRHDLGKEINDEVVGRIRNVRDFWRQKELQATQQRGVRKRTKVVRSFAGARRMKSVHPI